MKMEPIVSSETSAIRTQTPGNYPKRNNLHLEHGESLRTTLIRLLTLGGGVDHPLPSIAEVKGRVKLYFYSPSGPSWPIVG